VPEPSGNLDEVVHQRIRLGILTICNEARRVGFSHLRDTLELTVGNLSRHLQVLEEAGLITIEKSFEAKRPKTWVAITRSGKEALEREVAALRMIVQRVELARASVPARNSSTSAGEAAPAAI
jgi:DNA-binding MarR family transcriptional regulator